MTQTPTANVIRVESGMVTVMMENRSKETISYAALENASENNGTLTEFYRQLREQAMTVVERTKPTQIAAGEINTNVYGVLGLGADGRWHVIRWFDRVLRFRADEGMDLYSMKDARQEAQEIAERNEIPYVAR
jgi:hypothetical protein